MDILWLDQPDCRNPTFVGSKADLSRLAADYPVPIGFCLTTAPLDRWRASIEEDQTRSRAPVLAPPLYDSLAAAYCSLAERCGVDTLAVAIRSSAAEEDSVALSFLLASTRRISTWLESRLSLRQCALLGKPWWTHLARLTPAMALISAGVACGMWRLGLRQYTGTGT